MIELRVAAVLSRDKTMLNTLSQEDGDLHKLTAARISGVSLDQVTSDMRGKVKSVNFGSLFGMGARLLVDTARDTYGVTMTLKEAAAALRSMDDAYPGLRQWKRVQAAIGEMTHQVRTRMNLIRDFDVHPVRNIYSRSLNVPVQGTAAEILMCTLKRLPTALSGTDARLAHTVHDEILLEVSPECSEQASQALGNAMEEAFLEVLPEGEAAMRGLVEPMTGTNWYEVH